MSDAPNVDRLINYLRPRDPNNRVLGVNAGQLLRELVIMRERASSQWRDAVREAALKSPTLIVKTEELERLRAMRSKP